MAIELDGSEFGTNNGTTHLIEMSRNLYHNEITSSFHSRNLVSRVGHEMLESMPRAARSTPTPPGDAAPTVTGVARDLAKTQPNRTAASFVDPNTYLHYAGGYIGQSKPWGGWGARVVVTEQQSSPTTEALSKDDWDLLGFTTKTHSQEVREERLVYLFEQPV